MFNQKGSFTPILIGGLILVIFLGGAYFLRTNNSTIKESGQDAQKMASNAPSPTLAAPPTSTFQNLLAKNCLNKDANISLSGKISLETLPLNLKLDSLRTNKGICDSDFSKYVQINLSEEDSFLTISDNNSNHCCHGPSSLGPAGRMIQSQGGISIYIHTGTWGAGPNAGYKPIIVRGVRNFELGNGEEVRVILDKKALDESDTNLQKIEDKYQIIDPNFDSGAKVLTPETVEKMFTDNFFSNFSNSAVVKEVERDLQSITLKN
jgi:hypothetical protein